MDLTPEQRRVVYTLGFCGLVSAADNWFVSPALPAIASALGVAASAATIVLTAYLVPYGLVQPVCGMLVDRFGRLRVPHVIVAGLAAGALGFGHILTQPTLVSLSMDADPAQTGLCTGLIGLGVFAGGGVGSALGGQLVALGGYDALWLAAGALLVAQLVLGGRAPARLARRAG
ncbi:MAG: MFS transporter [Atopobiaceae bacterium]|nr:MFS transporter [Atopobiaceae bacterium]